MSASLPSRAAHRSRICVPPAPRRSTDDRLLADRCAARGAAHGARLRGARDPAAHPASSTRTATYDRSLYEKMGAEGLLGLPIPEQYGGAGMDYIAFALLCEEMERADTAFRVILSVHTGLNSLTLLQWGTEEQKQQYLVPQARGEKLATFGLTEPGVGSDAANLATTARRDGDRYILNGSKIWISLADTADHFLVFANVDRAKGHKGITAFIVERSFPGFSSESLHGKLGVRAGNTGHPDLQRLRGAGREPGRRGGRGVHDRHERHRPGPLHRRGRLGGPGAGVPRRIGQVRARAQDVRLGDRPAPAREADDREDGRRASRPGGCWSGRPAGRRTAASATRARRRWRSGSPPITRSHRPMDAIQIHGAYGYSNEYPVERYLRNSQGLGDLRGHVADPHPDAGRLPARLPRRQAAAACPSPRSKGRCRSRPASGAMLSDSCGLAGIMCHMVLARHGSQRRSSGGASSKLRARGAAAGRVLCVRHRPRPVRCR